MEKKYVDEWMNEEWMNEWMNKWMNEWMIIYLAWIADLRGPTPLLLYMKNKPGHVGQIFFFIVRTAEYLNKENKKMM